MRTYKYVNQDKTSTQQQTNSEMLEQQKSNNWTLMGPTKDRSSGPRQLNWNIKSEMRSFKSNENIHKKEGGSYYVVSAKLHSNTGHNMY